MGKTLRAGSELNWLQNELMWRNYASMAKGFNSPIYAAVPEGVFQDGQIYDSQPWR